MPSNLPVDLLHWSLAIFPMILLLVLLVFFRWKAAEAGALGVLCTLLTAALAFQVPVGDMAVAAAKGAWDSIYILYVIWPAMILYLLGKFSGAFDALGKEIVHISKNELFLVLGFGWVFASFFQGISGFGTPVAVAAPILVALGVRPVYAVAITLIGHAWANMFGTLAVSWIATSQVVAIQDPIATAIQATFLLGVVNVAGGLMLAWLYGRGPAVRHGLPLILIIAAIHGGGQILLSSVNPVLSNFVPGTIALLALYPLSKWQRYQDLIPPDIIVERPAMEETSDVLKGREGSPDAPVMSLAMAMFPYVLLAAIAIPMLTITPLTDLISAHSFGLPFPQVETGYGVMREAEAAYSPLRPFNHPGFFLLITATVTWIVFSSRGYFAEWARRVEVPRFGPELVSAAVPTSIAVVSYSDHEPRSGPQRTNVGTCIRHPDLHPAAGLCILFQRDWDFRRVHDVEQHGLERSLHAAAEHDCRAGEFASVVDHRRTKRRRRHRQCDCSGQCRAWHQHDRDRRQGR